MSKRLDETFALDVFTAISSGCETLARAIGLPVACLRASSDAEAAIKAMNDADYGGWTLWPDGFQPFEPQAGWRDWRPLPLASAGPVPRDVRYAEGRFSLDFPTHVTTAGFEAALYMEFRRFAVTEVTTTPRWLTAQSEAGRSLMVLPRYTLIDPNDFLAGANRVDDLFVIDPALHVSLVAQAILRARARALVFADEALRHA